MRPSRCRCSCGARRSSSTDLLRPEQLASSTSDRSPLSASSWSTRSSSSTDLLRTSSRASTSSDRAPVSTSAWAAPLSADAFRIDPDFSRAAPRDAWNCFASISASGLAPTPSELHLLQPRHHVSLTRPGPLPRLTLPPPYHTPKLRAGARPQLGRRPTAASHVPAAAAAGHDRQAQQQQLPACRPAPVVAPPAAPDAEEAPCLADRLQMPKLFCAGVLSSIFSRTCVAPLERVRMDMVLGGGAGAVGTAARVLRSEGVAGFWKGNALNLLRTAPFKAVNFLAFDYLHAGFVALAGGQDGNAQRFAAGGLAGVAATLSCFPLDVLRTRMMMPGAQRYGGPVGTLAGILRHEGAPALYSGIAPALVGMGVSGAVFYGVYDMLKSRHLAQLNAAHPRAGPHLHLPTGQTLLFGAAAGACSELAVYPLEILRRRMQLLSMAAVVQRGAGGTVGAGLVMVAAAPHLTLHLASSWACVAQASRSIMAAEGLGGFCVGLVPNMMQVLPSSALSYLAYDKSKEMLGLDR